MLCLSLLSAPLPPPSSPRQALLILDTLAEGAARLQLKLPDTVFAFNSYDELICQAAGRCVVPVFTMHKCFNASTHQWVGVVG